MANVLIVAYLLIVLALIAVILLQRSEGGGLGMGGNSNGLMSVRGSANLLTRTTAILATLFMATAIGLTILSELDRGVIGRGMDPLSEGTGVTGGSTILDQLNRLQNPSLDLPVPPTQAPAADAGLAVPSGTVAPPAAAPAAGSVVDQLNQQQPAAEPAATPAPAADPGLAVPAAPAPAAPGN